MASAHAYPTFELSESPDAVPLAKTAARERKLGPCPEIPYCPEIPSPLPYLTWPLNCGFDIATVSPGIILVISLGKQSNLDRPYQLDRA